VPHASGGSASGGGFASASLTDPLPPLEAVEKGVGRCVECLRTCGGEFVAVLLSLHMTGPLRVCAVQGEMALACSDSDCGLLPTMVGSDRIEQCEP